MHILYLIFIAPIELVLNSIFTTSYNLVHSYGLSIIILSAVMSIILIPVYNLADSWQNAERLIQEKMKNELDFIKRCFKKQERMVMTNTTHKLHHYHPIMAVRTSVGFLIQVPFFFGAYHLLSNYTGMNQVPFLIFKDLSQPDHLLSMGSLHINIMPIVMTIVSLLGGFIYTKNLARKDKIQLLVLTLVFLVLLYNSPVGLVIYWTLNNIFAVIKNVIPKDILKVPSFNITKTIPTYESKSHSTIIDKLFISLVFTNIFMLVVSFIALSINIQIFDTPFKTDDSVKALLPSVVLLSSSLILYYIFHLVNLIRTKNLTISNIKTHKRLVFIAFVSVVLLVVCNVNYIKIFITNLGHTNILIRNNFMILIVIYLLNAKYLYKLISLKLKNILGYDYNVMFYGLLVSFAIYIGCYLPISFIKNDTTFFNITPQQLLNILLPISSIVVILTMYINNFIVNKIFKNSTVFFTITLLSFLCFSFINMDYGILDGNYFTKEQGLYNNSNITFDIIITFAIITVFLFIASSNLYHYIKFLPIMFLLLIIGITTYNYHDMKKIFAFNKIKTNTKLALSKNKQNYLAYSNNTLNFSKDKQNIVVLIIDAFDGRYLQGMINDKLPAMKEFSGFTWYSNALSTGNATYPGYGSILGGFKYTPEYIEKHHHNIMQGYQDLYKKMLAFYQADNFETSLVHPKWYTPFLNYPDTSHCENDPLVDNCVSELQTRANYFDLLKKTYFKNLNIKDTKSKTDRMLSFKLSIFRILPLFSKQFIYNQSHWMNKTNSIMPSKMQFIASLPYISTTTAKTKTFKVIHTMIAHGPFQLNPNTCLRNINNTNLNTPYAKVLKSLDPMVIQNYGDDVCAIKFVANFIKWLKNNNVYDNTKIVLVSEHDYSSNPLKEQTFKSNAYKKLRPRPYFLLMVKDFNTNNKDLLIDTEHFVSTYDTPAILCDGLENCSKEYGTNFTKKIIKDRTIITSTTPWQPHSNHIDHYKIYSQVKVTNNIFSMRNYKLLPK